VAEYVIALDDPEAPEVRSLLERHLEFTRLQSPPEDVHALDIEALKAADLWFFSLRDEGVVLGVGGLKRLDADHAELKSIHTAEDARGRGVGRTIVDHLVDVAVAEGFGRVSLETGTMEGFAASRFLYQSAGFEVCEPFGQYWVSPHSVCMTRHL